MCRIVGFWDFYYHGQYDLTGIITAMRDTMIPGGPDDAGNFIVQKNGLGLGHRRLSIIDLSNLGRQPMSSADGRFTITYNGEVYNYREIRTDLEQKGYCFLSNTDTEVILAAYREWGIGCLEKFRGMWAFALWDAREKILTLCRDRVGVKPLYWYFKDGLLLFSSELKALHQHPGFMKGLDKSSLADFFKYGYIPAPYSIFKNVCKLEPGHFLMVDHQKRITDIKYWDIYDYYQKGMKLQREGYCNRLSQADVQAEVEKILRESFKLRMVADVPVGVFLSGGIDSSLVAALLTDEGFNLKTFTIGFNEQKYNEAPHAARVAKHLGTDHNQLMCTYQDARDVIPMLPDLYDEPFGDSSAIPTYLVSKLARQQVKVSLSGDGGDELFCGYSRYPKFNWLFRKIKNPLFKLILKTGINRLGPDGSARLYNLFNFALPKAENFRNDYFKIRDVLALGDFSEKYLSLLAQLNEEDLKNLCLPKAHRLSYCIDGLNHVQAMMINDFKRYLPDDILVKVDRATMGVSIEGREPLLDNKLIEYACTLPMKYKYKNGISKSILRDILYRYVPRYMMERPKQGFAIPVEDWLKEELSGMFDQYVNVDRIKREGLFNPVVVDGWLTDFKTGKTKINTKLWYLFVYQRWAERWL